MRQYNGSHPHSPQLPPRTLTPSQSVGNLASVGGSSTPTKPPHRLPPNINKELEKRKIGNRHDSE